MVSRARPLGQRLIVEKSAHVSAPATSVLCPVCVPVRAVGALGAACLAASHHLLAHAHLGLGARLDRAASFQLGMGEDLETSKVVFIQILDRVEQIAVERHQATLTGAKSRVTVRRSVRVQPCGGVILSA